MRGPLLDLEITAGYAGLPDVLRGVQLIVDEGESCGLIGASGSGKSTLSLAILGLLAWKGARVTGRILFNGADLLTMKESQLRSIRGREIALVMQSAATALNPALRLETQFREAWSVHSREGWSAGLRRASALLERVGLSAGGVFLRRYPAEVSLGQAQRILIALSLLHGPKLLLADEPTSALDVITQRELLELLAGLAREQRMATLFISHDLLSVGAFCDRVAILEQGEIVEEGPAMEVFENPRHPYAQALVSAMPARPAIRTRSSPDPLLALETAVSSASACPPESRTLRNSGTISGSPE